MQISKIKYHNFSFCKEKSENNFFFLAAESLADKHELQDLLLGEVGRGKKITNGLTTRENVREMALKSGKQVVVRRCWSGGKLEGIKGPYFFYNPFRSKFLTRPFLEFNLLAFLHEMGREVPKPVAAYVSTSSLPCLYRGVLVTEHVGVGTENLLRIIEKQSIAEVKIRQFVVDAGRETAALLRLGVFHCDLHLGNILVNLKENKIVIVDFDKAKRFYPSVKHISRFTKKTIDRFSRSVKKHGSDSSLLAAFNEGLKAR